MYTLTIHTIAAAGGRAGLPPMLVSPLYIAARQTFRNTPVIPPWAQLVVLTGAGIALGRGTPAAEVVAQNSHVLTPEEITKMTAQAWEEFQRATSS